MRSRRTGKGGAGSLTSFGGFTKDSLAHPLKKIAQIAAANAFMMLSSSPNGARRDVFWLHGGRDASRYF
jgi:hypothetical protein